MSREDLGRTVDRYVRTVLDRMEQDGCRHRRIDRDQCASGMPGLHYGGHIRECEKGTRRGLAPIKLNVVGEIGRGWVELDQPQAPVAEDARDKTTYSVVRVYGAKTMCMA